jgi:hypothetical protein
VTDADFKTRKAEKDKENFNKGLEVQTQKKAHAKKIAKIN